MLAVGATARAEDYITDVMVIGGTQSEINIMKPFYEAAGWTIIDQDLNAGCGSSSDYIYLLYKTASDTITSPDFITEFLLLKTGADAPDSVVNTSNNRTYYLVGYDGGSNFRETKGDLNSNAHGDYIHLYYSKYTDTYGIDYQVIKSIYFDNVSDGAVTSGDSIPACDLNDGAGGDYIYMHLEKSQGWLVTYNYVGTECYIDGFEGPKAMIPTVTVPYSIPYKNNEAVIIGISNDTFKGFTNLDSLFFYQSSKITQMPSVKGCSKLKHVNTIYPQIIAYDCTPTLMTSIPAYAFVGTAVDTIRFTSVTSVGAYVFSGCNKLSSVTFEKAPVLIEIGAFSNISSNCEVSYRGSIEDWNPMMYMYSQKLIVREAKQGTPPSWACGWCGGAIDTTQNHLYWTAKDNQLTIDCATDIWDTNPAAQVITSRNWLESGVNYHVFKLKHVYRLDTYNLYYGAIEELYLDSSLDSIGKYAIYNIDDYSEALKNIWYDGTQQQWESVGRDSLWIVGYYNYKIHWHCMVTFNANGHGTAPDPVSILWSNEDKLDEPTAPTANGYEFTGWYIDAGCTTPWNFNDVIPGDMTLYAGWEPVVVSKPGDANEDSKVDVNDVTTVINHILNKNPNPFNYNNANVNGDAKVDVLDVTLIINLILGLG